MLPDLAHFLQGIELVAKRRGLAQNREEAAVAAALEEAMSLSADREEDEVAALLYALTRRPGALGRHHVRIVVPIVIAHAAALGLRLTVDPSVLELIRTRILRTEIQFDELREWFAEHLLAIPRKPWPPS